MKIKTLILINLNIILIIKPVLSSVGDTATATGTQTVSIERACNISSTELNFGNIVVTPTKIGTKTIAPTDGATVTVSCPSSLTSVKVAALPTSVTLKKGTGGENKEFPVTLTRSIAATQTTLSLTNGEGSFNIGGTATVPVENETGEYVGSFTSAVVSF